MPKNETKVKLIKRIRFISERYKSPSFEPHVTLMSGFTGDQKDLLEKIEELSNMVKPFEVVFKEINFLDEFFRSVFIRVEFNDRLLEARKTSLRYFQCQEQNYIPHLGLAYGDFNLLVKHRMVEEVGDLPNGFFANEIFLAHNNEIELSWEVIEGFKLGA